MQESRAEEGARSDHEHREIDQAGNRHREHDVDPRVAVEATRLAVVARDDAVLGERRVQVDHVRHHRRAEDPDREQHRVAARELRLEHVHRDRPKGWVRVVELGQIAGPDRTDEAGDHRFEGPQPEPLQAQDRERGDAGQ